MTHKEPASTFSVAPMMDWTDRHCRYFHRLISRRTLLYTEMVTAPALIHGDAQRLLEYNLSEHPVALQIGGSDPKELFKATQMGVDAGYDEVNLNVGCPSDRVQSGRFGACLMKEPDLVAECVSAMLDGSNGVKITVKCRIGVDDQKPAEILPKFIETVSAKGVDTFIIHARMAWLDGLSPKENRDIPPLDYPLVHRMKQEFPQLEIAINGGLQTLDQAHDHIKQGLDGAMIGRSAYHDPMGILGPADRQIFGLDHAPSREGIIDSMIPYIERHLSRGGKLHQITRHMLGLFAGQPGARAWKRHLSENAHKDGADHRLVLDALAQVNDQQRQIAELR